MPFESKSQELRSRLEALKRGEKVPVLAASAIAAAYEHDTSQVDNSDGSGILAMKAVPLALGTDEFTPGEDPDPNVAFTPVSSGEKETLHDGEEAPAEAWDNVAANSDTPVEELPLAELYEDDDVEKILDQQAPADDVVTTSLGQSDESVPAARKSKTKIVLLCLSIVCGLAIYSMVSTPAENESTVIGLSSVPIDPPAPAPSLGPVQGRLSSVALAVQGKVSSGTTTPTNVLPPPADVKKIAAVPDITTSKFVGAKPKTSLHRPVVKEARKPIGAVLPVKYKAPQKAIVTVEVPKNSAETRKPVSKTANVDSIIDMLEKAKSLN